MKEIIAKYVNNETLSMTENFKLKLQMFFHKNEMQDALRDYRNSLIEDNVPMKEVVVAKDLQLNGACHIVHSTGKSYLIRIYADADAYIVNVREYKNAQILTASLGSSVQPNLEKALQIYNNCKFAKAEVWEKKRA